MESSTVSGGDQDPGDRRVSAADIARMAGVTRAAVSNWRRRYEDFPAPIGGSTSSPLFSRSQIAAWLEATGKGADTSDEVRLWNDLRGTYPDSIVAGIADVAELLDGGAPEHLPGEAAETARRIADETSPSELLSALAERLSSAAARTGGDSSTPLPLVRYVAEHAAPTARSIYDPACGTGSLLFACGAPDACRAGQDADLEAVRLTSTRARIARPGAQTLIHTGDSLRSDAWEGASFELVVCDPPIVGPDWGREELLMDPRWESAVPPRAEGELAWLLHCYAHTAAGGTAAVVMSPSAAHRRTGRRIRADLVRRGLLTEIVALPAGYGSGHSQPVHLWIMRRPGPDNDWATRVRMTDLTGQTSVPSEDADAAEAPRADVSLVDLLDDTVDLTPSRWITPATEDFAAAYADACDTLRKSGTRLFDSLPVLTTGTGEIPGAAVRVSELVEAGLAEIEGQRIRSRSDRLDEDFLNGFLHSPENTRRSTSTSGTFRTDSRSARIPQMTVEQQRRFGEVFRALEEFERQARIVAESAGEALRVAREGLTSGALDPDGNGSTDRPAEG
ncbi:N-6 DNA methylase [Nocardiopsis baichengensis]|uniref:N-6 DNA methylase n=1 Tax=Nocardiopsis baichengensis TaxID=280240 RepID=UPI00034B20E9|nr:N-6 DNA methylase [Nocardiopsis baichengensis]